jgi:hypothetical protein
LGKTIAGEEGVKLSIAVAPHRGNDQISINWVKNVFGKDLGISCFFNAVEGTENILKHGPTPLVPLRMGTGLDSCFQFLLNPSDLMKKAILNAALEENADKAKILKMLAARTASSNFANKYRHILGSIPVTCNKTTKQKIPLQKFASMPSVVSIMNQHKIRTICSISGTTIGCILSIISSHGEEKAKELLQPLLDYLEGDTEALNSQAGLIFKKLATELSFFMQTGQYHTAGEVLAALYIAGKALTIGDEEFADIDKAYTDFSRLMEDFSKKPETFFAIEKDDLDKINSGKENFRQSVIASEKARFNNSSLKASIYKIFAKC